MTSQVSVILPTFNRADLIAETLDSLLVQTRPVNQILVVDDGSTDGVKDVVLRYADKVTYVRQENGGKSRALNFGMTLATGDYIWICDDDDLLEPDACERLAGALDEDPLIGFCAGRHDDFTVDPLTGEQRIKAPGYWLASKPEEIFPDLLDGCHIFQPGMIVRRSVYAAVGEFNPDFIRSQDYEMLLRIARNSRGRLCPERVCLHREHSGARGSAKMRFTPEQNNEKWMKFHRMIFDPLMADLSDDELLAPAVWLMPEVARVRARVALLKRGRVFARHMMWPEALATFTEAARLHVDVPLSEVEKTLIAGATTYSFGCAPLYEVPAHRAAIMALKTVSPVGRSLAMLISRSLHWRIRNAAGRGQFGLAMKLTAFAVSSRV